MMKKIFMSHIILIFLFSLQSSDLLYAQCTELSQEEMIQQNGLDAILIDDFTVKLKEGTIKRPIRTKRVDIFLEPNILYRFSLFSLNEQDKDAVVQLYDHRELLGSSFANQTNTDLNRFEYMSDEPRNLQLVFSSKNGNKVCATVLFSMVLQDTTTIIDKRVGVLEKNSFETLYMGIDNEIEIAASGVDGGYLEVSISEGSITGNDGVYTAKVGKPGIVNIKVRSFEKDSSLHEENNTPFMVIKVPDPQVKIGNVTNGGVSLSLLKNANEVSLNLLEGIHQGSYELIEFAFAKDAVDIKTYKTTGTQISNRQKLFLNTLKRGDEFFIKETKVLTPEGKILILEIARFKVN